MFKCEICNKEFTSGRMLGGHKSVHREGGRYSVSRRKRTETYECLNCNVAFSYNKSSTNKFCTIKCSSDYSKSGTERKIQNAENISESTLRRYVFSTCEKVCAICGLGDEWQGKKLGLHLDHIDGDSDNNTLANVRILCPNCHSQTENFGSKGNGSRYKKITKRNKYLQDYKKVP